MQLNTISEDLSSQSSLLYILGCSRVSNDKLSKLDKYYKHETEKHLLSIAPTRTGKGCGLILPNLLNFPEHSVFVIDPKGENALVSAKYRRDKLDNNILIFNPHGIYADEFKELGFNQFQTFNPLADLSPDSRDFADEVANIAEALIYEETGGDSHWVQAARGYVAFLIMFLVADPEEIKNKTVTLRRLWQIIAGGYPGFFDKPKPQSENSEPKDSIYEKAKKSNCHLVRDNASRYAEPTPEVYSLIATAETQISIFKSELICSALEGKGFDFEEMKKRKTSVYLILPSKFLITQARYMRLVLLVAMSQFMRREKGNHQVVVMLDEFANLGALNIIANGYGLIAGHGVTLWSFVQNLTQLQHLYPNNWETFIANSSVVTVSNVNDVTTAEYFSRRAGQSEMEKEMITIFLTKLLRLVEGLIIHIVILVLSRFGKIVCRFLNFMMLIPMICIYFMEVKLCLQSAGSCNMMWIAHSRKGLVKIRCTW